MRASSHPRSAPKPVRGGARRASPTLWLWAGALAGLMTWPVVVEAKVGANSFCNSYVIPPAGTGGTITASPLTLAAPRGTTCVAAASAGTPTKLLTTVGGSLETGEPLVPVLASSPTAVAPTVQGQTVWFQWTPVQNTTATITATSANTDPYQFQPIIRIYTIPIGATGLTISSVVPSTTYAVAPSDATKMLAPLIGSGSALNLAVDGVFQSVALLSATAQVTYLIQIDGVATPNFPYTGQGNFSFSLTPGTQSASPPLFQPQSGWWYSPNYPGAGFAIETRFSQALLTPGAFFMGVSLYDQAGNPTWSIAGGQLTYDPGVLANAFGTGAPGRQPSYYSVPIGTQTVNLVPYSGGSSLGVTNYKGTVAPMNPGTPITLRFFSSTTGQLEITGFPTPLPIQRYAIPGAIPATTLPSTGASATTTAIIPQTGWYMDSTEPGRGYFVEYQAGAMMTGTYLYRLPSTGGTPIWYVSTNTVSSPLTYTGRLYEYAGGPTLEYFQNGLPTRTIWATTDRGAAGLKFTTATNGVLTIGNVNITLVRYLF